MTQTDRARFSPQDAIRRERRVQERVQQKEWVSTIGRRIRSLRMIAGWEGKELAGRAGLSASALSKIENGTQLPSSTHLFDISDALTESPTLQSLTRTEIRDVLWGDKAVVISVVDVAQQKESSGNGAAQQEEQSGPIVWLHKRPSDLHRCFRAGSYKRANRENRAALAGPSPSGRRLT